MTSVAPGGEQGPLERDGDGVARRPSRGRPRPSPPVAIVTAPPPVPRACARRRRSPCRKPTESAIAPPLPAGFDVVAMTSGRLRHPRERRRCHGRGTWPGKPKLAVPPGPPAGTTPRPTRTAPAGGIFRSAPGDIVVSTRSKSSTTWVQMICLLLVFGDRELPGSPRPTVALAGLAGRAQRGGLRAASPPRRTGACIKTHTPARRRAARRPRHLHRRWAATRSTWPSPSTTTATTSTAGRMAELTGQPESTMPPPPAAARVARGVRRLGRRRP